MIDKKLKSFVISILRRATYRWKPRSEAYHRNKVERGRYTCEMCKQVFARKEVQVDHIEPVIPVETGFTTFDNYIERMFCNSEGFAILCISCHEQKTAIENNQRVKNKTMVKTRKKGKNEHLTKTKRAAKRVE